MTLNSNRKSSTNGATPTGQRPSNIERLAQWRAVAERTRNAKLINTVDILETLYANEATRPPTPTLKGGDA